MYEHDCDWSGSIRWRCTRRGDGIRARAFLEPRANGPRSLPCLAIIVHFAMVLDLARKLKLRSA
jgi:hypothetical protein